MSASTLNPKILVVFNGKGGVGKTTTAVNIAAILAENHRVLLMDTDPQHSATWWVRRNDECSFEVSSKYHVQEIQNSLQTSDHDCVVIDTPPAGDSEIIQTLVQLADYLILPTPPSPMDLTALIKTVQTVVMPIKIEHRVLLTRVDPRSLREALEAQNTLMELGVPAFHSFVRAYKAHERAALEGLPITQWKGKQSKEAKSDYYRVVNEIKRDWEIA